MNATRSETAKPAPIIPKVVPEPMGLILSRQGEVLALPMPYRVPEQNAHDIRDAASAYAEFNNSDPFAFKRMALHLRRGLELASKIAPEYRSKIRARHIAAIMVRQDMPVQQNEELSQ